MKTPTETNQLHHLHGDCTGIIPEGTELTLVILKAYHQPGMEQPYKGPRPKKGNTYFVNGKKVLCTESRFKQGSEYSVSWWEYTLVPA